MKKYSKLFLYRSFLIYRLFVPGVENNFNKLNVYFVKLLDDLFTDWTFVLTFFFDKKNPKLIFLINFSMKLFLMFWKYIRSSFFINYVSLSWTFAALNVQDNFNKLNVCFVKVLNFLFIDWTFVLTFFFDKKKPKLMILISSSMTLFLMFWKYIWSSFFINYVSLPWTFAALNVQDNFNKLECVFR